jgi:hypothetical protein
MFKIANSTHSSVFDYEQLVNDDKELWLIRVPQNVSVNLPTTKSISFYALYGGVYLESRLLGRAVDGMKIYFFPRKKITFARTFSQMRR